MDTRALKNPYHDYDANPALTRELFDSHGRVREDKVGGLLRGGGGFMYIDICTHVNFSPAFFSSHQSFRSGCAAKSTNFFQ